MRASTIVCIASAVFCAASAQAQGTLRVYLDMFRGDSARETDLLIYPGTTAVTTIALLAQADQPGLSASSIGYFGGIDRGIAIGHMPRNTNAGALTGISAEPVAPIIAGATQGVEPEAIIMKAFDGPEFQYLEWGANAGPLPVQPRLILTISVDLRDAAPCDVFDLAVFDLVSVWAGGDGQHGAFTVASWLDTGGDAVPDGTLTTFGIDKDVSVPVPPGAFVVDYIDGPASGGPATISVTYVGDIDRDRDVDLSDLARLLSNFGTASGMVEADGDVDGDGDIDLSDLALLLRDFGSACR